MKLTFLTVRFNSNADGESLIETAFTLPLLLMLLFNAVNMGYFFFVTVNLTSAPRTAVLYSTQGGQTQNQLQLPVAASVQDLAVSDISGSFPAGASAPMQVCSSIVGLNNPTTINQAAQCTAFNGGSATFPSAADLDPEAPAFVANRVDIAYTVTPLVQGPGLGIVLPDNLTLHRYAVMRAMN